MASRTATAPRPDVRSRLLASGPALVARLVHYRPGLHQPTHAHETTQLSFLVLGEVEERVSGRQALSHQPSAGLKRAGTAHDARFGPAGALILCIEPRAPSTGGWDPFAGLEPCRWYPTGETGRLLARAVLQLPAGVEREDLLADLMACVDIPGGTTPPGRVPAWLARVRERLRDAPSDADIADLAREAGVHRVHLSRRFQQAFAVPPSVYRARCRVAHAVAQLAAGANLADVSVDAGFSDQAHMTRALRLHAGLTPNRLRACLA